MTFSSPGFMPRFKKERGGMGEREREKRQDFRVPHKKPSHTRRRANEAGHASAVISTAVTAAQAGLCWTHWFGY